MSCAAFSESPLVNHELHHLRCLCAVASSDPLAESEEISAADLAGKPMGALYEDHPNVRRLEEGFAAMDARLNVRVRTQYYFSLLSFVERGRCYAAVDLLTARSYERFCVNKSALVFRPFLPAIELVESIMTPAHRPVSQLVEVFISELRAELELIENWYAPP